MSTMAEMRRGIRWRHIAVVVVAVSAALTPATVAGSSPETTRSQPTAAVEGEAVPEIHTDQEALAMDTARFAEDVGVSLEEASAYVSRGPLIDELRRLLRDKASETFSDLYIAYNPYSIVVLSLGKGDDEFELVSGDARFQELVPFIEVRHVDYTETLLVKAMEQIGQLAGESGTQAANADIRTGSVTVWVDSDEAAAALTGAIRSAEASGELLIPAASIDVLVGFPGADEDSFAGTL